MKKLLLLFVSITCLCSADDLYIKNGILIKNVKFNGYKKQFGIEMVSFLFNNQEFSYPRDIVTNIDPVPYNPLVLSTRYKFSPTDSTYIPFSGVENGMTQKDSLKIMYERLATFYAPPKIEYPNIHWLAVSAVSFGLAWDFFARSSDVQDAIDSYKSLNAQYGKELLSTTKLENEKTRVVVLGVLSIGSGIFTTVYALKTIEIKTDGKSLSLAVQF